MIALLAIGTLVLLLFINLTGLTVLSTRFIPNYLLAKVTGPVLFCLGFFCFEHFIGLGDLSWLGLVSTGVALWLIAKNIDLIRLHWRAELLFALAFGYVFMWRMGFPNLDGGSEKLTDLTFITNYLSGDRLPAPDNWFPPYRFDIYYGFQYYSSALLGRMMRLNPGMTYHFSLSMIAGLTIVAAAGAAMLIGKERRIALLAAAAFTFGSTGGAILVPRMSTNTLLSDSARFIGGFVVPEKMTTELGQWIGAVSRATKDSPELPAETFGYLVYLGDHHPPMSGYLLLTLALLCIALWEAGQTSAMVAGILAATVPIVVVSNSWNLPMQALLLAGWICSRLLRRMSVPWIPLAAGFVAALLLTLPFLASFGMNTIEYGTKLRFVPWAEHPPLLLGLIVFAPILLLLFVCFTGGFRNTPERWWALLWLCLLLFSELFYIDDVYSGKFDRFNTTLKWWPWVMAGITISLGPLALTAKSSWRRILALGGVGLLLWFAVPLTNYYLRAPKPDFAMIDGAAWIRKDVAEKPIFEFLKQQPHAIVLQRYETDAFTGAPGLIIHAGHTAFMGWPAHEKLWRNNRTDIEARSLEVKKFYRGELPNSAEWLLENHVDHVLWLKSESQMPSDAFSLVNTQIGKYYLWREYYRAGSFRVGLWSRRNYPAAASLTIDSTPLTPPTPAPVSLPSP